MNNGWLKKSTKYAFYYTNCVHMLSDVFIQHNSDAVVNQSIYVLEIHCIQK